MKKRIGNEFWNSGEAHEAFRSDTFEEAGLHPHLARIIGGYTPEKLLDFGCGDGALLPALDPSLEIGLYDPNLASARLAAQRSGSPVTRVYEDLASIRQDYYDVVVLSFVLICFPGKEEFLRALHQIRSALREGGVLIVAEGHPCFRDRQFVGHHVNYPPDAPFNYNAPFHEFNICLHGDEKDVEFYDYHWTLSDTLNTVIRAGFTIDAMHEIADSDYSGHKANPFFPPYLVICSKKQTSS